MKHKTSILEVTASKCLKHFYWLNADRLWLVLPYLVIPSTDRLILDTEWLWKHSEDVSTGDVTYYKEVVSECKGGDIYWRCCLLSQCLKTKEDTSTGNVYVAYWACWVSVWRQRRTPLLAMFMLPTEHAESVSEDKGGHLYWWCCLLSLCLNTKGETSTGDVAYWACRVCVWIQRGRPLLAMLPTESVSKYKGGHLYSWCCLLSLCLNTKEDTSTRDVAYWVCVWIQRRTPLLAMLPN